MGLCLGDVFVLAGASWLAAASISSRDSFITSTDRSYETARGGNAAAATAAARK